MNKDNRTSSIKVMLTADEKAAIIAAAHQDAQDASPWLRRLAMLKLKGTT